jgi:hypothetical protein
MIVTGLTFSATLACSADDENCDPTVVTYEAMETRVLAGTLSWSVGERDSQEQSLKQDTPCELMPSGASARIYCNDFTVGFAKAQEGEPWEVGTQTLSGSDLGLFIEVFTIEDGFCRPALRPTDVTFTVQTAQGTLDDSEVPSEDYHRKWRMSFEASSSIGADSGMKSSCSAASATVDVQFEEAYRDYQAHEQAVPCE